MTDRTSTAKPRAMALIALGAGGLALTAIVIVSIIGALIGGGGF